MSFALFRAVCNNREANTKVTKETEEVTKIGRQTLMTGTPSTGSVTSYVPS